MDHGDWAYFEGQIVSIQEAKISVMTHAFNYGTAVFEGIRGYWNEDHENLYIFRLQEHIDRMLRNSNILMVRPKLSLTEIQDIIIELTAKNGFREDTYIRPVCYKSEHELGPRLHDVASDLVIYEIRLGDYVNISGLKVAVSSWRRLRDNAIPARCKATGAYVNSALAATEAKMEGFDEAVFLGEDGTVSEGSAENLFLVQNGVLITPPVTADILTGITRNTIIELARNELGLDVVERPVGRTELYVSDEMFFCGTGAQVAPVVEVDRRPIGTGKLGDVTINLQKLYFDVVQGKIEKYRHWCTPVYDR
ncbi:MAG: branched-chain amino acid transaminase [Candidatus Hydrogenedentes bacterium]|nr:branched-chain amino acid transaminase [Candidatus Hydrogenedentota bacterium]